MENEELSKYFTKPKKLKDVISLDEFIIVFDTNILLSSYQWRGMTGYFVKIILQYFFEQKKLKYSYHVIKEYTLNRPKVIKDMMDLVYEKNNNLVEESDLEKIIPILQGTPFFEEMNKVKTDYEDSQKKYKEQLEKAIEMLEEVLYNDTFLDLIQETATEENIILVHEEKYIKKIKKEVKELHKQEKKFPGYEDIKKNNDNYFGDYLIWKDLLSVNKNIIFVSNDKKKDWVIKNYEDKILTSNPMLIQEFHEKTNGKYFIQTDLISLVNEMEDIIKERAKDVENIDEKLETAKYDIVKNNEIDKDTIIVPANEEGFNRVFLGEDSWHSIRINESRIKDIKYIAAYQTAPISAITYYAKVKDIINSDEKGQEDKKKIIFDGKAIKLEKPIYLGKDYKMAVQGPRYDNLQNILSADTLSELFS